MYYYNFKNGLGDNRKIYVLCFIRSAAAEVRFFLTLLRNKFIYRNKININNFRNINFFGIMSESIKLNAVFQETGTIYWSCHMHLKLPTTPITRHALASLWFTIKVSMLNPNLPVSFYTINSHCKC